MAGASYSGTAGTQYPSRAAGIPYASRPRRMTGTTYAGQPQGIPGIPYASGMQGATTGPTPFSSEMGTQNYLTGNATYPLPSGPNVGMGMQPMSPLEQSMSSDGEQDTKKPHPFIVGMINQFGYNFFSDPSVFAPLIDAPVGPDYIVGPGDTLVVTTWGSIDGVWQVEVNRSGEIILPRVGAVKVWGVTFAKVPDVIREHLSRVFREVQLNVTMGKLRLIKVYLVGEVASPGDYDVSSLSTVINALAAAGGPTKNGSLRSIQVMRNGKVAETVDLYDFFLKGDKSRDIRLQSGDTVNVPIIGKVAGVAGNVRRPAIYELKNEKNLKDLIELAGGFNPSGYLNRLQISRIDAHSKKMIADFSLDPKLAEKELEEKAKGIAIQDQDLVKIFPIDFTARDNVRLDGYVLRPGPYALKPGMRVKDLIGKDNILPESYSDTIEIIRMIPPDFHPEAIYLNLDRAMKGNESDNILLTEFDNVRVFNRWEMQEMPRARINGDVQRPGEYRVLNKMTLRDLVLAAGNVRKTAYLKSVEITRSDIIDGKVQSHIINVALDEAMKGNPKDNILLKDMDEVVVRRVPDWKEETDRYFNIRGEVRFPGVYPLLPGEKLSSLITRAGGYTERAYLKGAKFTRKSVAEIQQKRMDEIVARTESDIIQKQQDLASTAASKEELEATKSILTGMKGSLDKLKLAKAEGRISFQLAPIEKLTDSPNDLPLQGGDTLEIPQSTNSVQVYGEVYNPTTIIALPGKNVAYYLKKAGGPTINADEDSTYVIKVDGTVVSSQQSKSGIHWDDETRRWTTGGFKSLVLDSGDTIVVPQNLDKIAWMREIKDIATIIGQIALTAGVAIAAM